MAAKSKSTKPVKAVAPKKAAKPAVKAPAKAADKSPVKSVKTAPAQPEWLQDVSIEAPVPGGLVYEPGKRQLEFSVGMRQQDENGHIRSELRARALVHTDDVVLVLIEASYVNIAPENQVRDDLPHYLYSKLKPQLEGLLAIAGHTPPLPASLDQIA